MLLGMVLRTVVWTIWLTAREVFDVTTIGIVASPELPIDFALPFRS
jgi:hypothetical protein